jgi:hypothetical protein
MSRGTSREILRRTSSFAEQRFESPAAPPIYHSPESLPQVSGSSIPQTLSEQAEKLPCISDNSGISQYSPLPSLGSSPMSPSHSGQTGICWNPLFNISDSSRQDCSNQAVETSPNFGRTPSQSSSLGDGVEKDIRVTASYPSSTFSSTSTRSSVATEYSQVETTRLSFSSVTTYQLPDSPYCNNAAGSVSPGQVRPPSSKRSSLPLPVPVSPVLAPSPGLLPLPTIERMPIEGEIKMLVSPNRCLAPLANHYICSRWYHSFHRILCDLDIARISGRGASEVQMTLHSGIAIVHRGMAHRSSLRNVYFYSHY